MEVKRGKKVEMQAQKTEPEKQVVDEKQQTEKQQKQAEPTHVVVDIQTFNAAFEYIMNQPMANVEQLVNELRQKTKLVNLPN